MSDILIGKGEVMHVLQKSSLCFQRLSLRTRMILIFFVLDLLILGLIAYPYYIQTAEIMTSEIIKSKQDILGRFAEEVEVELDKATGVLYKTAYHEQFREIMSLYAAQKPEERQLEDAAAMNKILSSISRNRNFTQVRIYFAQPRAYTKNSYKFFTYADAASYPWLEDALNAKGEILWTDPYINYAGTFFSLKTVSAVRAIIDWNAPYQTEGLLSVDLDIGLLFRNSMLKTQKVLDGGLHIINDSGNITCSLLNAEIGTPIQALEGFSDYTLNTSEVQHSNGVLYLTQPINMPEGWQIVLRFPTDRIQYGRVLTGLYITIAWVFAALLFFNFLITCAFTRSLKKTIAILGQSLDGTGPGPSNRQNLSRMVERFMLMSTRNQALINTINKLYLDKTEAQLSAMRAKINPHFLYNQLDVINWIALRNSDQEVSQALSRLARFYRSHLAKGSDIVTVEQELEHLNNYIELMRTQTQNTIQYSIACDHELLQCQICSMLVQPLVENAIHHGVREKDTASGTIEVGIHNRGTFFDIIVKDDGGGIPPEIVRKINLKQSVPKRSSGFGVFNIQERIAIYYGEDYGMSVASAPGKTVFRIRLPKVYNVISDEE